MSRIIDEIFKRKKIIITLFILLLGYGIYSYIQIPKQEMPEIDTPYMVLQITAPSMSATEIEESIVDDVEKAIMTYEDVVDVRSTIYDNFAVIITSYSFSSENPDALSAEIFTRVLDLELSDNITNIEYTSTFDDPHIIFSVHSDSLSEVDLLRHAEHFKNDLLLVDEINSVNIESVFQKEVVITLNQELLELYGLSLTDIYSIIYANTLNLPLGGINTVYGTISISGNIEVNDQSDLEDMIIIPFIPTITEEITLGDISTILLVDTSNKEYEFNDQPSVFISVFFKSDIDFTKMGPQILDVKEDYLLEENITELSIDEMLFLPDYVDDQIANVFNSLLIAVAIVMVIVFFGIGLRNSMLIIITVPIIIFGTIAILFVANFELHKLTIVGLIVAIGILVDNQIVITEGIKRNIDYGMDRVEAGKKAILDNLGPVLSSTLTTIAAFLVIVILPGFLGEIVASMPLTVIIAISLSFIVAMGLSPVLAIIFLKARKNEYKESIHEKRIKKMIELTIKFPLIWISLSVVTLGLSSYFVFDRQPIDLYPNDERSVLYIDYSHDRIGDFMYTDQLKDEILDIINENDHVQNYSTSLGGNLPGFHFSAKLITEQAHVGRIYVNYDYNEESLLNYKKQLELELKDIDASININTLELSPPLAPVRILLTSEDANTLDLLNDDLYQEIQALEHIKSYQQITNVKSLKYHITYDFTTMSSMRITKAEIDSEIAIHLNGFDLEVFEFNNDIINIQINSSISTIEDVLALPIYIEVSSTSVPLSTFIEFTELEDYSVIERLNNKNANILNIYPTDDSDNVELENEIKTIIEDYDNELVKVVYSGENDLFKEITEDLIKASIIAVILIFIIMFIQFNNFIKPFIVLLTIPLSFTGSFLFLMLFNEPITATALVGMVSLIGVTVNTGILLVEYISRQYKKTGDITASCVDSVYLRFRPVILTSATTVLGLIPLLLTGGNFFRPMAITFMGGMITSTLITIFLVPSIYFMIYRRKQKKKA